MVGGIIYLFFQKKNWIVIPKPKKLKDGERSDPNDAREWRMSFLDQEREILNGSGTVKPTIKLLKVINLLHFKETVIY